MPPFYNRAGDRTSAPEPPAPPARAAPADAYRGFVMFLMTAEVFRPRAVAKAFPDSGFWGFLAFHQSQVEWRGCSLHDLIQPSFSFRAGAALASGFALDAAGVCPSVKRVSTPACVLFSGGWCYLLLAGASRCWTRARRGGGRSRYW